jgi:hypothetical protein
MEKVFSKNRVKGNQKFLFRRQLRLLATILILPVICFGAHAEYPQSKILSRRQPTKFTSIKNSESSLLIKKLDSFRKLLKKEGFKGASITHRNGKSITMSFKNKLPISQKFLLLTKNTKLVKAETRTLRLKTSNVQQRNGVADRTPPTLQYTREIQNSTLLIRASANDNNELFFTLAAINGALVGAKLLQGSTQTFELSIPINNRTGTIQLALMVVDKSFNISPISRELINLSSGTQTQTPAPAPSRSPQPASSISPAPSLSPAPAPSRSPQPMQPTPTRTPQQTQAAATPRPTITSNATPTTAPQPTQPSNQPGSPGGLSRFPLGKQGINFAKIEGGKAPFRSENSRDTFRTGVSFSHFNFDDPIVFPGRSNATHLHMFFGNSRVNAFTVPENIRSNCLSNASGGTANCSGYWIPALLDANQQPILQSGGDLAMIYYKTGYGISDPTVQRAPPVGLRMIAGTMRGNPGNPQNRDRLKWNCSGRSYEDRQSYIPVCNQGSTLELSIVFPRCWDGRNLDSPDHQSHMAYAGNCPASHPVAIPEITFNFNFKVNTPGGTAQWRLSSDMYDMSSRGGYSIHADWINGWDPSIMEAFINNCNRRSKDCAVDLLGDGRQLMTP